MRPEFSAPSRTLLPAAVSGLLAVSLAFPAEMIAEASTPAKLATPSAASRAARTQPLSKAERAEHALSRLTFGPRPGEVARVERQGLDKWLESQLHPERIDDSALAQRLQSFPAMQLTQEELLRRFPSPAMLRMGQKRFVNVSADPVQRAVYADASAGYEARKDAKAAEDAKNVKGTGNPVSVAPAAPETPAGRTAMGQTAVSGMAGEPAGMNSMASGAPDASDTTNLKRAARKEMRQDMADTVSDGEVQSVLLLAPDARFAKLVAMPPDRMLAFRAALRPVDRLRLLEGLRPEQKESVEAMAEPTRVVGAELLESRLMRDLYSERQLQAVMTDFWLNHFNIYDRKSQEEPYLLPAFERDVILPHALGHFEDLLVATAQSPAMLMYLDNWQSIGPDSQAAGRIDAAKARFPNAPLPKKLPQGINENYARELMELHTLGVNGGYTQKDVIEVAKCLTGWTIDKPYQSGEFRFEPKRHEPGPKVVLGNTIAEGGEAEGLQVLHTLATSSATAHFLSQKLAERFVSDTPPPTLVDAMAKSYLKSDGDISAVLRTMFKSKQFWAPAVYKSKVKTPLEFVASAVRASGATVDNDQALVGALNRLGMPLYGMQTPNGYSWKADEWVNSNALVARLNLALVFSTNRLPGTHTDWASLLGPGVWPGALPGAATSPLQSSAPEMEGNALLAVEPKLETVLLGEPAGERTRSAVLQQIAPAPLVKDGLAQKSLPTNLALAVSVRDVVGPARPVRANAGKGGVGGLINVEARQAGRTPNAPTSPLDTMAGLLLGSPEFQRR